VERMDTIEVHVELCHARGEGVGRQAGQGGLAAEVAQGRLGPPRDAIVRVVDFVNVDLSFKHPELAPSRGVVPHLAGLVVR
jgi:hypothetical protein